MKLHTFLESKSKVWHRYTVYLVYLYAVIAMNQSKSQTHSINNFLSNFLSSSSLHQQLFDKKNGKTLCVILGARCPKTVGNSAKWSPQVFYFPNRVGENKRFQRCLNHHLDTKKQDENCSFGQFLVGGDVILKEPMIWILWTQGVKVVPAFPRKLGEWRVHSK